MITVGMNYSVIPGKDELFVSVFAKVMAAMSGISGHVKTRLLRDAFNQHEYVVLSEWSDEGAFEEFIRSDRFRNVANWGKENVLAGRPVHQILHAAEAGSGSRAQ